MLTVTLEMIDDLDLGVLAHAPLAPADAEWESTVRRWDELARRVRARDRQPRCLVLSEKGHGPNAKQRKLLEEVNAVVRPRVAVATGSSVARGIVTAISWLGHTEIRAFAPGDIDGALAYLGAPTSARAAIHRAIAVANGRLRT